MENDEDGGVGVGGGGRQSSEAIAGIRVIYSPVRTWPVGGGGGGEWHVLG